MSSYERVLDSKISCQLVLIGINNNTTRSSIMNTSQHLIANRVDDSFVPSKNIEKIVIYSILFVIASIGNTTSFVALLFMKKNKSDPANSSSSSSKMRIRLLLMNLCIADLIVTYIHMPLEIVWAITNSWLAPNSVCKLMMFLRTFGSYLSSFVLITITIGNLFY
jgi:uncharacterized membrane protein